MATLSGQHLFSQRFQWKICIILVVEERKILISRLADFKVQLCEGYLKYAFQMIPDVVKPEVHFSGGNNAPIERAALAHAYIALGLPEQNLS